MEKQNQKGNQSSQQNQQPNKANQQTKQNQQQGQQQGQHRKDDQPNVGRKKPTSDEFDNDDYEQTTHTEKHGQQSRSSKGI